MDNRSLRKFELNDYTFNDWDIGEKAMMIRYDERFKVIIKDVNGNKVLVEVNSHVDKQGAMQLGDSFWINTMFLLDEEDTRNN